MSYADGIMMAIGGAIAVWIGLDFRHRTRANPHFKQQAGPIAPVLLIAGPLLVIGGCAMAAIDYLNVQG